MKDFVALNAADLVKAYGAGEVSPVEVTRATLDQIHRYNDLLNAWVIVDDEGAVTAAEQSEDRWRRGETIGAIDGVPVGIKELFDVKGWPTRFSSPTTSPDHKAQADGPVTARMREAGGIILGKTATPEFSWKGTTDSALHGVTRNPWNTDMTPGGSSGGASAACAAGMGPLQTGTDAGGSIRIPACFTGLYGLKTTQGRVPNVPISPTYGVSQAGPITRTVEDAALMLNELTKPDPRDPFALEYTGRDWRVGLHDGVEGMRIAYFPGDRIIRIDPEVDAAVKAAVREFEDMGAIVEEADPGFENIIDDFLTLWRTAAAVNLEHARVEDLEKSDRGLVRAATHGRKTMGTDYVKALQTRAALGQLISQFFANGPWDLMLMPTTPIVPFEVGQKIYAPDDPEYAKGWTPLTFPFNVAGNAAASIPCGFTQSGLPIGLQIVGPWYSEATILRASRAYESRHPIVLPTLD